MSNSRLVSGRVKKLTGAALDLNRNSYLSVGNAEPDLGLPAADGQVLVSTIAGVRSWAAGSAGAGSAFTASATAPTAPAVGDEWFETDTGILYTYITDGDSAAWIELGANPQSSAGTTGAAGAFVNLFGPTTIYVNQVVDYAITDYDSFSTYTSSVTAGSVSVSGATVTVTAPATAGTVTVTLASGELSRTVSITVLSSGITTPTITNPANNSTVYLGPVTVTFTSSAFQALGAADTHLNTDWELSTTATFDTGTIFRSSLASTANKTSWSVSFSTPATYWVRVRHRGTANGVSTYSTTVQFTVAYGTTAAPNITSTITSGTTEYPSPNITFTSSAFTYLGTFDTHASTTWQISTDNTFVAANFASVTSSTTNLTAWSVTGLSVLTTYYVRVRYTGATNGVSAYSPTFVFTTIDEFQSYIATPLPTPAAFGDAFEGGFYAGMIWNQATYVSQVSFISYPPPNPVYTYYSIGVKTFTVPDMTDNPIFYQGQQVEARLNGYPDTVLYGTVSSAGGTVLTINVSAVGAASNWGGTVAGATLSIMAKYRVILAPKAQGQSSLDLAWSNTPGAPTASVTLTEGYRSTQAIVAAGDSTRYPAAWFCKNLTIGGYSDWYLPARDELELCYRNLKAGTTGNVVSTRTKATDNYATLGAYNDAASTTHGVNLNSSPPGAAYTNNPDGTTLLPPRTTAVNFQLGNTEAWLNNSSFWTSSYAIAVSELAVAASAWQLGNAAFGTQDRAYDFGARSVRAVRRSAK